ncbi:MAG: O-antigen ligase family protein [Actinobacteria bacterium]|nr:O-antigen ligase family protein [Actinomycetota bacterium]
MSTWPLRLGEPGRGRAVGLAAGLALALLLVATPIGLVAAVDPSRVVLAVVVALVVAVCALRVDVALLLLVAATPLEAAVSISANPLITVTKVTGALCFASFAIYAVISHRKLRFDRTHVIVFLILALALLSTLQAREFEPALSTTVRYASFVALYVVVSQLIGDYTLQRRLAWVLSISSAIAGVIAMRAFLDEASYQATLPYGDPNDLAFTLATTLPLTIWLMRERWILRPVVAALIGVIALSILLTYSRGALVGLAAATLFLLATERRRVQIVLVGGLVTLVATMAFLQTNAERVEEGIQAKSKVASYNVETRLEAWDAAVELASERPFLGVGPGNFRAHYGEVAGIPPGAEALGVVHNAYLDVAAELGIPALVLFLAYLVQVFIRMTLARRWENGLPGFASAVRLSFVVAIFSAMTLSEQYYAPFWLLGALGTALWAEGKVGGERPLTPLLVRGPRLGDAGEGTPPQPGAADDTDYDLDMRERLVEQRERRVAAQVRALREEQQILDSRSEELAAREAEVVRKELEASGGPARRGWALRELERLVAERAGEHPDRVAEWRRLLGYLRTAADSDGFLPAAYNAFVREAFGDLVEGDGR